MSPQRETFTGTLLVRYKIEAVIHAARRLIAGVAESTRRTGVTSRSGADGTATLTTVTTTLVK